MSCRALALIVCMICAGTAAAQDIYKWKDDKGQWQFSQTPPKGGVEKLPGVNKPLDLPRDVSCTSFKIGESRTSLAERPGHNSPVAFGDVQVKLIEQTEGSSRYAWKVIVKNVSGRPLAAAAVIKLMDCDRYLIVEEQSGWRNIDAYREEPFGGEILIIGARGAQVGRFHVGVGAPR